jgi:ribosomal protein S9
VKSVATVELVRGTGKFTITIPGIDYMQQKSRLTLCYSSPLDLFQLKNQYDIGVNVMGGGFVKLMLLR